jgi:hypothetical protein|tara:strand:+ start:739 stop:936 length:198 start_codon:yes stop_codon:yes gene_type:complete
MILISFDNNETIEVSNVFIAFGIVLDRFLFNIEVVKVVAVDYNERLAISNYVDLLNTNANKPKEV